MRARISSALPRGVGFPHSEGGFTGCRAHGGHYVLGCMLAPAAALRLFFLFGALLRGSGASTLSCGAGLEE